MDHTELGLLQSTPGITRRRLDVDEYYRMAEAGILGHEERVELIEGELVVMSPIGSGHAGAVNALTHMLVRAVGERAVVSVQNPLRLDRYSEPEPDVTLLRPRGDFYRRAVPMPEDVLLVIEVAESSLRYDRAVKRALYARHAIPEFWLVNVVAGEIEICRNPAGDAYGEITLAGRAATLVPVCVPDVAISAAVLLG